MELWIRSQDKYTLMKIEEIQICENSDRTWFMNAGIVLGKYKTKEKALEVLDEIQNLLQPRVIYHEPKIDYDDMIHSLANDFTIRGTQQVEMELKKAGQIVYEMPKE